MTRTNENRQNADDSALGQGFWDWSMEVYPRPGIAERLLRLQDNHGLDVNLTLWCFWAADHLDAISPKDLGSLVQLTQVWAERVTQPLRGARKWMKGQDLPADDGAVSNLRGEIKALELKAERISQDVLEAESRACAGSGDGSPSAGDYFATYLGLAHGAATQDTDSLETPGNLGEKEAATALFDEIAELITAEDP